MTDFPNTYHFAWKTTFAVELLWLGSFPSFPDRFVRTAAVSNPCVPNHTLLHSLYDPDFAVCASALEQIADRVSFKKEPYLSTKNGLHGILEDTNLVERAMGGQEGDNSWYLRSVLGKVCDNAGILAELFARGEWAVQLSVLKNQACPLHIVQKYAELPENIKGKDAELRMIAKRRLDVIHRF